MFKYIGIRPAGPGTLGNEGVIWTKNQNGVYVHNKLRLVRQERDILDDVKKGYLKKLEENDEGTEKS